MGFSTVAHEVALEQLVPRAMPLIRIADAEPPLPATKFTPRTTSGKASTSPAMVLDGRMASIAGPLEIEIVADADFVGSASLVAVTEIALGEGAALGAVYTPLAVTEPQAVPAHPAPLTALSTLQVTLALPLPATCADELLRAGRARRRRNERVRRRYHHADAARRSRKENRGARVSRWISVTRGRKRYGSSAGRGRWRKIKNAA